MPDTHGTGIREDLARRLLALDAGGRDTAAAVLYITHPGDVAEVYAVVLLEEAGDG